MTGKWPSCCWESGCGIPESIVLISTRGHLSEWEFKLSKCRKRLRIIWGLGCGLALNIKSARHANLPTPRKKKIKNNSAGLPKREDLACTWPDQETKHRGSQEQKINTSFCLPWSKAQARSWQRRLVKGTPEPHQCQPVINSVEEIAYTYPLREVSMQTRDSRLWEMLEWGNQLA